MNGAKRTDLISILKVSSEVITASFFQTFFLSFKLSHLSLQRVTVQRTVFIKRFKIQIFTFLSRLESGIRLAQDQGKTEQVCDNFTIL